MTAKLTKGQRDFLDTMGLSACVRRSGVTQYKKPRGLTQIASVKEGVLFRRKSDGSLWIKPYGCPAHKVSKFIKLPSK